MMGFGIAMGVSLALMLVFGVLPEMWDEYKKQVANRPPMPDVAKKKRRRR